MTPEQRLEKMGITLPVTPVPQANYVPWRFAGPLLYLSGQGPRLPDGSFSTGRLGRDVDVAKGYQDARYTGLQLLATAKARAGELARIEAVVKLLGMVNAEPDFAITPRSSTAAPTFCRGAGEAGHHARSAVGMGSSAQPHDRRNRSDPSGEAVRPAAIGLEISRLSISESRLTKSGFAA